jgi:DNA-binding PadR family transcriptional regulator
LRVPNPNLRRGRPNPYGPTGLSRKTLLALADGPLSIDEILDQIGPRSDGVTHGTIWTILDRATHHGLLRREKKGRSFIYSLTDGGERRIRWIQKKAKAKLPAVRVVANPKSGEEE